jgi:hypothetical protein
MEIPAGGQIFVGIWTLPSGRALVSARPGRGSARPGKIIRRRLCFALLPQLITIGGSSARLREEP